MNKKLNSMGRVAIALVLALSLSLVVAVPVAATNQDEAPAYVAKGDTDVLMLQFDVENTNPDFARNFTGVRVSFSGDSLDDVLNVMVLDSGETEVSTTPGDITFDSSPISFAFSAPEAIGEGATETYYIAIDIASDAIDQNLVSIALVSIDGDEEVGATATLPFSSGSTEIDADAPLFDSAITGDSADGNSTVLDNIYLSFTEEVSGLDSTTVATTDFTIATPSRTVSSIVEVGADYIVLGLDADLLTDDTPSVTLASGQSISDLAGNESITGSPTELTAAASDGLKPTVDSVLWDEEDATKDTLDLTFSENIGLPGVKGDYSVNYAGRVVNVESVDGGALDDTITLNIPDQSLEVDSTDAGEFTVTVSNPGNVKDTNGNSVDPANNSASVDVDDFVAATDIVSAVTVTTTTIDVTFNEDLDGTTVDETGFTVDANIVVSATETSPGVVTLTLETAIATDATPDVDYVKASGTLEDIAGIEVEDCTATTPDDGIAPTMDSAVTVDTTTIDVTFSEDLDDATVDEADFSVVDNTVTGISESAGVVTLTLETAIATDATPDVTYTAGSLADGSGNTVVTSTVTPTDGAGPVLNSVTWIDVNGDDEVNPMDTLTFTFSEAMDQSTITASSVDANLVITSAGTTYGTGAVVSWTVDDTVVVTLAIDTDVVIGDTVDPDDAVEDALDNPDATPAVVKIEDLTDTVLLNGVHYPTIQDAITDASEGDIITVGPGTYEETLTIGVADLTLESTDGRGVTIIDAKGASPAVHITADDVTVEGFTITSSTTHVLHSILVDGGVTGAIISLNLIENLIEGQASQIALSGVSDIEVSDNILTDSFIWLSGVSISTISRNDVSGVVGAGCITIQGSTDITIQENSLHDGAGGVIIMSVGVIQILDNDITANAEGIAIDASITWDADNAITYNTITGNTVGISNYMSTDIDATLNYWGSPDGPATGDVSTNVDYSPWLDAPYPEGLPTAAPEQFSIDLVAGWNLISVPLVPTSSTIATVLAGLITETTVDEVRTYWRTAEQEGWDDWAFTEPHGDLTLMEDGPGYWIKMNAADALVITGSELPAPPETPKSYSVYIGWNLIGFKSLLIEEVKAEDYLDALEGVLQSMYRYDAANGVYVVVQSAHWLIPGQGYWLAVSAAGTIYP